MRSEVHTLGVFVHGALTALHTLGFVFNARRRNYFDMGAHLFGLVYSLNATVHHARCVESRPVTEEQH